MSRHDEEASDLWLEGLPVDLDAVSELLPADAQADAPDDDDLTDLDALAHFLLPKDGEGATAAPTDAAAAVTSTADETEPDEWAIDLEHLLSSGDDLALDDASLLSVDDLLSRRRAKNRIAARLCRQRKKQTLSALELRLESLEAVSRLLDEQLKSIEAQNATLIVEMRCTSSSTRGEDRDDRSLTVHGKRAKCVQSIDSIPPGGVAEASYVLVAD
jgi:hypothetical protein